MLTWRAEALRYRYGDRLLERKIPGLALLFDAYALVDLGTEESLRRDERRPVCGPGCSTCCSQPIPVSPLEILAVHAYALDRLDQKQRRELKTHFEAHTGERSGLGRECPFVIDHSCSVYPVRPIICRQFHVFGAVCAAGEDPCKTRPRDVLIPNAASTQAALLRTLPWYQGRKECPVRPSRREALAFFRSVTTVLQSVCWRERAGILNIAELT